MEDKRVEKAFDVVQRGGKVEEAVEAFDGALSEKVLRFYRELHSHLITVYFCSRDDGCDAMHFADFSSMIIRLSNYVHFFEKRIQMSMDPADYAQRVLRSCVQCQYLDSCRYGEDCHYVHDDKLPFTPVSEIAGTGLCLKKNCSCPLVHYSTLRDDMMGLIPCACKKASCLKKH